MKNEPSLHPFLPPKWEKALQVSLFVAEMGDGGSTDLKSTLFVFLHEQGKWRWLQTAGTLLLQKLESDSASEKCKDESSGGVLGTWAPPDLSISKISSEEQISP